MAKRKPDVRWDGERHWFRLPYAARLAGRTKADMLALAADDAIAWEQYGKSEYWFERLAILALQDAGKSAQRTITAPTVRKPKSAAQLERQWAKQAAELAKAYPKRGGGVSRHHEKVLLSEIAEAERKRKGPA